jgi:hypothetical protein
MHHGELVRGVGDERVKEWDGEELFVLLLGDGVDMWRGMTETRSRS